MCDFALGALAAFATLTVLLAVGGLAAWLWYTRRGPEPAAAPTTAELRTAPLPTADWWAQLQALAYTVTKLETTVAGLPGLWEEAADRAQRAAERAQKAERRSRARSSDEDEEPDDEQLSLADGRGGAPRRLQSVPAGVDGSGEQAAYLSEVRRQVALAPLKAG